MTTARIEAMTAHPSKSAPRTVIYTDLYEMIEAVQEAIEPGEETYVTPIVAHLLRTGQARWLRKVDMMTCSDDITHNVPPCEAHGVLV